MSGIKQEDFDTYIETLSPIFNPNEVDAFEYACSLLRVGGMQDEGWDTLQESREVLDDLIALTQVDIPSGRFKDIEKTRWRLRLISYAHLTEMDAPYHILANLLRVRAHMRYVVNPFKEVGGRKRKKKEKFGLADRPAPPSPKLKIKEIKKLGEQAGFPAIGSAFDDFYFPPLRHAIDHSDYILHDNEFRMPNSYIPEGREKHILTSVVLFEQLGVIFARTYAFYSAFFVLERRARAGFGSHKGKCFPYDYNLKGLLEFLINQEGLLYGFKIHWPNEHDSVYRRTETGCEALNISLNRDGSINFFVGEYFRNHDPFSELIPTGGQPCYKPAEGLAEPPQWPSDPRQT